MKNKNIQSTFLDKELESLVEELCKKNPAEIFNIEYKGEKLWVKKARKTSSNIFHKLCYKMLSYDILVPVQSKSAQEALLFESNKLIEFKNKSIPVPSIIGRNSQCFVMSDTGQHIYGYLKKKDISSKEFYYYLDKVIFLLSEIHNKGFYHGGAQTRNFTYKSGILGAIDLEDSFEDNINIKTLQFRDLMLLLLSMTKVDNFKVDYNYIIREYCVKTDNYEFKDKLKQISKKLYFLQELNNNLWINKILPRDAKGFSNLIRELKENNGKD